MNHAMANRSRAWPVEPESNDGAAALASPQTAMDTIAVESTAGIAWPNVCLTLVSLVFTAIPSLR